MLSLIHERPEKILEFVPLPTALKSAFSPAIKLLVRTFVGSMLRKYPFPYDAGVVRGNLLKIRKGLQASGGEYLLGQFSYAGVLVRTAADSGTAIS